MAQSLTEPFGALLPDIDHPASWVGWRLRVISRPWRR